MASNHAGGKTAASAAKSERVVHDFGAKQAALADRLSARAAGKREEASARHAAYRRVADAIPMGQPILVGHHSENRHRRDVERMQVNARKSVEANAAAKHLEQRAANVGKHGVSSDDPHAIHALEAKLAKIESDHATYSAINKAVRSKDPRAALAALGHGPKVIEAALAPDFAGRKGIPDYRVKNNAAEGRRVRQRIAELTAHRAAPVPKSETIKGVKVHEAENRVRLDFGAKPNQAARTYLKSNGFKWSPSNGVWQRQSSPQAWHHARQAAELHG